MFIFQPLNDSFVFFKIYIFVTLHTSIMGKGKSIVVIVVSASIEYAVEFLHCWWKSNDNHSEDRVAVSYKLIQTFALLLHGE
jgi:hypothetical protein